MEESTGLRRSVTSFERLADAHQEAQGEVATTTNREGDDTALANPTNVENVARRRSFMGREILVSSHQSSVSLASRGSLSAISETGGEIQSGLDIALRAAFNEVVHFSSQGLRAGDEQRPEAAREAVKSFTSQFAIKLRSLIREYNLIMSEFENYPLKENPQDDSLLNKLDELKTLASQVKASPYVQREQAEELMKGIKSVNRFANSIRSDYLNQALENIYHLSQKEKPTVLTKEGLSRTDWSEVQSETDYGEVTAQLERYVKSYEKLLSKGATPPGPQVISRYAFSTSHIIESISDKDETSLVEGESSVGEDYIQRRIDSESGAYLLSAEEIIDNAKQVIASRPKQAISPMTPDWGIGEGWDPALLTLSPREARDQSKSLGLKGRPNITGQHTVRSRGVPGYGVIQSALKGEGKKPPPSEVVATGVAQLKQEAPTELTEKVQYGRGDTAQDFGALLRNPDLNVGDEEDGEDNKCLECLTPFLPENNGCTIL